MVARLADHAASFPDRIALEGNGERLSYAQLANAVDNLAAQLQRNRIRVLGLALDNRPAWAICDLAALAARVTLVPLPAFFSAVQTRHALADAGVQTVISDRPDHFLQQTGGQLEATAFWEIDGIPFTRLDTGFVPAQIPTDIARITYTSGTTGTPKGVMLTWRHIEPVVRDLVDAVGVQGGDRLLALNPLGVLLENIGSVLVPIWAGATGVLPSLNDTGLQGASGLDGHRMAVLLATQRANAAIFMPQTLLGVVEALEDTATRLPDLRFAAVGGASVSTRLLARAEAVGIPVFEGYGMSECASVMCLNRPGGHRPGSVGKPLPHLQMRALPDGDIQVRRGSVAAYLGDPALPPSDWWSTGDLGRFDDDGYLYLRGRRRNAFITAFGRNVSPEWVETELTLEPAIAQAAVFGEARKFNVAVLVASDRGNRDAIARAITHAVRRANASLPDYARIGAWVIAEEAFTPANGLLTGTGRVRREAIYNAHRDALEHLYREDPHA
ncbi:MAG: AMP-binding protein [Gammaproteobacteria bacterium]|nr:AMP-binding protein [Gammaproteobacteria bacterium]MCP5136183.1 AMP-binding protein [Gammaproteobacteria bacterium]